MPLLPGTRLGPFEVTAQIGVGGMGEVYQATDTNLKRPVAIKVLPESVSEDAGRVARFQREAEVLAALNHPNIAAIYGLERSNSIVALVMELVEGPTLSERLEKGPLAVDDALSIANQIAEALAAAHEQGIVHRDLKPANVKVRGDGTVKVLDFGLAKAVEPAVAVSGSHSLSPTITTPAMTQMGMILGTAAYMSPEQAKGRAADKRSDVWAFGCVLYEMLTGKRAFEGEDISDTLAAVLRGDPDWSALPADLGKPLRTLMASCLAKDRRERLADIAGALFVLKHQSALGGASIDPPLQVAPPRVQPLWRRAWPVLAAMVVVGIVSGWLGWMWNREPSAGGVTRFGITLPRGESFTSPGRHLVAISPDGSRLVYVTSNRLNLRMLDELEGRPIRGTELSGAGGAGVGSQGARNPFFSPDGQWIGYWSSGQLKKISINGGVAVPITNLVFPPIGSRWDPDGTIVFAQGPGIWRVSANGGQPEEILKVEEARRIQSPQVLPGGRAVLFTLNRETTWDGSDIVVQPIDGGPRQSIATGTDARYLPTGHIAYVVRGALFAVPFDVRALKATGGPVALAEGIAQAPAAQSGAAHFAVSENGTLVYATTLGSAVAQRSMVWVDRRGGEEPLAAPLRPYLYPRLSPDGTRIASDVTGPNRDIWIWDLARQAEMRLTTNPEQDRSPTWTPDGKRVIYTSDRNGYPHLFWQAADAVTDAEQLTKGDSAHFSSSMSPDGTRVVLRQNREGQATGADLIMLVLDGRKLEPLISSTNSNEFNGEVSPDGRWLAYQTNRSGRYDVFVRPFPDVARNEWPISTEGGTEPLWSRDTSELFYRAPNGAVMGLDVMPGQSWKAGTPRQIIAGETYFLGPDGNPYRTYDVSLDGRRFLMLKNSSVGDETPSMPHIIVVTNWFEELKRRVPTQ